MSEEFHFGESLLFSNATPAENTLPDPAGVHAASESADVLFAEPVFSQPASQPVPQSLPPPSELPADQFAAIPPTPLYPAPAHAANSKEVKLFNGSSITLRARRKRNVTVDFSAGTDSILNMDELHERVSKNESVRATQNQIWKLKQQNAPREKAPSDQQMWSEKYKPKSFMQICPAGNERQYRLIMQWLRKWGRVVFGAPKEEGDAVDHLGRPLRKILLVHGPPGVGKTAVVHLLARQMGYAVEELNAANSMNTMPQSEATDGAGRFANATAALKLKVKNALTTNTITANGKPTCLVIDEIDSSINAGDIVRVVADLVRTDQINTRKSQGQHAGDHKSKPAKKPFFLNRPIICIANDIYTSSVRSGGPNPMEALRPLCEVVNFRKHANGSMPGARVNASAQKSVKEYLMEISEKERLGLDRKEIAEVYEVCEGDIRACLNYLQFSCRRFDADMHRFQKSELGSALHKDSQISWFALVDHIFRRNQNKSKEDGFHEMLEMVSAGNGKAAASGSLDKVIRGCFNKYLDVVHLQDDSASRPAEISDWLYYYDLLTSQNLSSEFYPALAGLKFWSLFSDHNPQKFRDMPGLVPDARNLDFSTRETLRHNTDVTRRLSDRVAATSKSSVCSASSGGAFYACELIPLLDRMLSPEIGSARTKASLTAHEAAVVEKIAQLVKTFDIHLESQRDVETGQTYLLYGPDWEGITMFERAEQNVEQRKKAANVKRQWLFPLLQAELDTLVAGTPLKRQAVEASLAEKADAQQKRARLSSSLDFFKGRYDDMSNKIASAPRPVNKEATRIWVKHHEGFSNAVRKNIGWHELWH